MEERKVYSLSVILNGIRKILEAKVKGKFFWLKVELSKINFHSTGHCYLELSETNNGKLIAQCKGAIWKSNLESIKKNLGNDFQNVIKQGNEILCFVEVQFTEQYGLSIIVKDVDITFNLGAMEVRRKQTLERLEQENLLNLNKEKVLPIVIQKIAIIGSPQTDGINDLKKQLENNTHGYHFFYKVFPCIVQGVNAENEILARLRELKNDKTFEVVALVRGGGSKLDLDVFNSYEISKEIALHPKPVLTGIGHDRDISVVDLVANKFHKTPTALGSFIVERAHLFDVRVTTSFTGIIDFKDKYLNDRRNNLKLNIQTLTSESISRTQIKRGNLHTTLNRIIGETRSRINIEKNFLGVAMELITTNPSALIKKSRLGLKHTMELMQINSSGKVNQAIENYKQIMEMVFSFSIKRIRERLKYSDDILDVIQVYHPNNILSKGYGIPKIKGKLVRDQKIQENEEIEIELLKRVIIVSYKKDKQKWMNSLMSMLQKS